LGPRSDATTSQASDLALPSLSARVSVLHAARCDIHSVVGDTPCSGTAGIAEARHENTLASLGVPPGLDVPNLGSRPSHTLFWRFMSFLMLGVAICVMGTLGLAFARPRKRFAKDYTKELENLLDALEYKPGLTGLQQGAKLEVEQLDLQGLWLYTDEQKAAILATGAVDDFFLTNIFNHVGWARKSDEGVKWNIYFDSEINLHKGSK